MSQRQRLQISIAYADKSGTKRFVNDVGVLWLDLDTMQGSIELRPGIALVGGPDHYINVATPRERQGGGGF